MYYCFLADRFWKVLYSSALAVNFAFTVDGIGLSVFSRFCDARKFAQAAAIDDFPARLSLKDEFKLLDFAVGSALFFQLVTDQVLTDVIVDRILFLPTGCYYSTLWTVMKLFEAV